MGAPGAGTPPMGAPALGGWLLDLGRARRTTAGCRLGGASPRLRRFLWSVHLASLALLSSTPASGSLT